MKNFNLKSNIMYSSILLQQYIFKKLQINAFG